MSARILIAEDDPLSLSLLKMILESTKEFTIETARDGQEAWAKLETGARFDLCIFDIMMPFVDGLQLTARLRNDPRFREQRVILCTALNDRTQVDVAASLAVSHYIVKPYSRENVIKQVRRICHEKVSREHFEPPASVAARLGVARDQLQDFLRELHRETTALAASLRADPAAKLSADHKFKVNSLKGAAANLGARSIAAQLTVLESHLGDLVSTAFEEALVGLEVENARLGRELDSSPVESIAQSVTI
ncbi:MAG TPA: response regulator [Candidatus Didemnitutus sp.]|nr:response regulator [Candidatus Didemnitutus sp.]